MPNTDICFLSAHQMARLIRRGELSCREVMDAHLKRIARVNPRVNAIVTLLAEQAQAEANKADETLASRGQVGPLHGLPIAHKDLLLTAGVRTTLGSPLFRDFIPNENAILADRVHAAGAIMVGKTNTPEFGAGSQTYNEVFGETLNPYDVSKTCGGSSGGAAVSLATGMVPLADGSDLGGSLRNPASFCNVVGFRPSPGRIPTWPHRVSWFPLAVEGPMARCVQDVALLLSVISGPDPRVSASIAEPGDQFLRSLDREFSGTRVAWSPTLDGLPVDSRVLDVIQQQLSVFDDLGCAVEEATPDLNDADEVFRVLRAWYFNLSLGDLLDDYRHQMKDTVVWNIEEGRKLTGPQIGEAEKKRTLLYHRVREFMGRYDFLLLPVAQVPPFDVKQRYVGEINGVKMQTYLDWMRSCYYISTTELPAISVPCGFTPDGLPIGLQIVGGHHDDMGVLQLAYAFEQSTGIGLRHPKL